jgi:hypothetical protein
MGSKAELKSEFRVIAGYTESELSSQDLDTVISRAKKHIESKRSLEQSPSWYEGHHEEALFWYTCLFSKVAMGELDSQQIQVGAIDVDALLAKEDDDVTTWYRNAVSALRSLNPDGSTGISGPERANRNYGDDSGGGDGTIQIN